MRVRKTGILIVLIGMGSAVGALLLRSTSPVSGAGTAQIVDALRKHRDNPINDNTVDAKQAALRAVIEEGVVQCREACPSLRQQLQEAKDAYWEFVGLRNDASEAANQEAVKWALLYVTRHGSLEEARGVRERLECARAAYTDFVWGQREGSPDSDEACNWAVDIVSRVAWPAVFGVEEAARSEGASPAEILKRLDQYEPGKAQEFLYRNGFEAARRAYADFTGRDSKVEAAAFARSCLLWESRVIDLPLAGFACREDDASGSEAQRVLALVARQVKRYSAAASEGDFDYLQRVMELLHRSIEEDQDVGARLERASLLLSLGYIDAALSDIAVLNTASPDALLVDHARLIAAVAYARRGLVERAREEIAAIEPQGKNSLTDAIERVNTLLRAKEETRMAVSQVLRERFMRPPAWQLAVLSEILERDPMNATAMCLLARVLAELGQSEGAIVLLEQAERCDRDSILLAITKMMVRAITTDEADKATLDVVLKKAMALTIVTEDAPPWLRSEAYLAAARVQYKLIDDPDQRFSASLCLFGEALEPFAFPRGDGNEEASSLRNPWAAIALLDTSDTNNDRVEEATLVLHVLRRANWYEWPNLWPEFRVRATMALLQLPPDESEAARARLRQLAIEQFQQAMSEPSTLSAEDKAGVQSTVRDLEAESSSSDAASGLDVSPEPKLDLGLEADPLAVETIRKACAMGQIAAEELPDTACEGRYHEALEQFGIAEVLCEDQPAALADLLLSRASLHSVFGRVADGLADLERIEASVASPRTQSFAELLRCKLLARQGSPDDLRGRLARLTGTPAGDDATTFVAALPNIKSSWSMA